MTEGFGNYQIIRKIAAGGMAEVFLAKHTGLGGFERLVCIKRILPHLGEQDEFIKMFQDEARIAANVTHPNIAQIYDIGEANDSYYIAMEYVRGEDLRRVYNQEVSRGRAMPGEQAAQIVMYAAAGLDFAHRQLSLDGRPLGIVHRDISPQNMIVSYDGHVKVVDFGIAKAQGKLSETRVGVLKGKYSYMSPEQASGKTVDGRTDVFALGITLYEVTTGTRLFKRESEIETLHAVIDCQVREPRSVSPSYDPDLEQIVLKALRKCPDDRFSTAGDMERALERYLVDKGYPSGASSLADYMHDLFSEKLADAMHFEGSHRGTISHTEKERASSATRRLTPATEAKHGSSRESSASSPLTAADEPTVSDEQVGDAVSRSTSSARSTTRPTHTGGARVRSRPESQTATDAVSNETPMDGLHDRARSPTPQRTEHHVTERSKSYEDAVHTRQRPSTAIVFSILAVIIALVISVATVLLSPRNGPVAGPSSRSLRADEAALDRSAKLVPDPETALRLDEKDEVAQLSEAKDSKAPEEPEAVPQTPRTTKPSRSERKKVSKGFLKLNAPLPLEVWSRGKLIGKTPLRREAFPSGQNRLRLENPEEGLVLNRRVRIAEGETKEMLLDLKKGNLAVQASPWARVKRGTQTPLETPTRLTGLFEGDYRLRFECPDGSTRTEVAHVQGGETSTVNVDCRSN